VSKRARSGRGFVREIPDRVTSGHPCPVCGRGSWCCYWSDGTVLCARVSSEKSTPSGWVHKPNGRGEVAPDELKREAAERQRIVDRIRRGVGETPPTEFGRIASALRVPLAKVESMAGVFIGWDGETGEAWDGFPMWSPDPSRGGEWAWCGWSRRYAGGKKKSVGKSGLFLPGTQPDGDVLYVVEGYSDVLAMAGAGLPAVGRPSNIAGSDLIVQYVRLHRKWRAVVVVAENDEKADGLHPGLTGAVTVADRVRAGLNPRVAGKDATLDENTRRVTPVFVRRMPGVYKDPRQWFSQKGYDRVAVNSLVSQLTAGIQLPEGK